jgi:hypothetical protein
MDAFEIWWQAYPKKTAKGAARKSFQKAITLTTLDAMLAALEWQRTQEQWVKDGGQWIPMPSTYLNQERWEAQPMEQPTGKAQTVRNLAVVAKWAQR